MEVVGIEDAAHAFLLAEEQAGLDSVTSFPKGPT